MIQTKTALHFSIDMDWLTRHVRQLWAEASYQLAMDTLLCLDGLDDTARYDVIRGKLRLTNDYDCAEDDWQPDLNQCHLRQYPDPERLMTLAEKGINLEQEVMRLQDWFVILTKRLIQSSRGSGGKIGNWTRLLNTMPDEALERNGVERRAGIIMPGLTTSRLVFGSNEDGWQTSTGFAAGLDAKRQVLIPTVDRFIERRIELDHTPLPEPDTEYKSENGYILPDGTYLPCRWMEHNWLADRIEQDLGVPEKSLIKTALSQIAQELSIYLPVDDYEPALEQIATAAIWCSRHDIEVPRWALPH